MPARPTALIAEDEPLLAAHLRAELARHWPSLAVVAQVGDGASALRRALELRPAVCWLDIRMPGLTGLEAAQALAEDWPDEAGPLPLLVFVTAYDQYALQAFEAQAVDYLVKPVQADRLQATITRLQRRLAEREAPAAPVTSPLATPFATSRGAPLAEDASQAPGATASLADAGNAQALWLSQLRGLLAAAPGLIDPRAAQTLGAPRLEILQASAGNTVHLVPIGEVLYFEAADKYLRVLTAEREHLIRLSLRELLPQLDPAQFWQVHRSLVVRASAIHTAVKEDNGKVTLHLRGRPEKLTASRLYAHLFKGL